MPGEKPPSCPLEDGPDLAEIRTEGVRPMRDGPPERATSWQSSTLELLRHVAPPLIQGT
jgi:hypothetical protein